MTVSPGESARLRAGAGALLAALTVGACSAGVPAAVTPAPPTQSPTGAAAPADPTEAEPDDADSTAGPSDTGAVDQLGNGATRNGRGAKQEVDNADLVELGDQLTAALASGDVEQWLALCALSGAAEQQQRDWFAAVQAVPMDLREMHATSVVVTDAPGDVDGPIVEFGFRHQVRGADLTPSIESYKLTLEREGTDGPYKVVRVDGSTAFRTAYPQLWDVHPVTVLEGDQVIVLVETSMADEAVDLLPDLDAAAGAVFTDFPVPGVDRMVVNLADQDVVSSLFGDSDIDDYAGFTVPVQGAPEVVISPGGLADLETSDDLTVRIVLDVNYTAEELDYFSGINGGDPLLRHEGLHLAMMLTEPDGFPPPWVSEGMAGWFEVVGDDLTREDHLLWYEYVLEEQGLPEGLPPSDPTEFFTDDVDLADRHYVESAAVFLYIEERFGRDATIALGRELHGMSLFADEEEATDEATRTHLGIGMEQLEADWLAWVSNEYGR